MTYQNRRDLYKGSSPSETGFLFFSNYCIKYNYKLNTNSPETSNKSEKKFLSTVQIPQSFQRAFDKTMVAIDIKAVESNVPSLTLYLYLEVIFLNKFKKEVYKAANTIKSLRTYYVSF